VNAIQHLSGNWWLPYLKSLTILQGKWYNKTKENMEKLFLLFAILLLWNGCSLAIKPYYNEEISFVREIFNFHIVEPNVMRRSQPSARALRLLKKYYGVKTILSLRDDKQVNDWERQIVEKLGMTFINIPMSGINKQKPETIAQSIDIISDKSNHPIFVHCKSDKDRTGMIFAAYRIKYDNWSYEDALMEMYAYGYDPICCAKLKDSLDKWNAWRQNNSKNNLDRSQTEAL
jgi:protein tyrosine phosphatase (PTP) superfamily phosphohydrolase (DUF442 family)